jgi:hypothetical protein
MGNAKNDMIKQFVIEVFGLGQSPYATLPEPIPAPSPAQVAKPSAKNRQDAFVPAASAMYGHGDVRTASTSRHAAREAQTTTFEWEVRNDGGKSASVSISAELSEREAAACAARNVPRETAQRMKRLYAGSGGELTAQELSRMSGLSLSYAQKFLASIRSTLSENPGEGDA